MDDIRDTRAYTKIGNNHKMNFKEKKRIEFIKEKKA